MLIVTTVVLSYNVYIFITNTIKNHHCINYESIDTDTKLHNIIVFKWKLVLMVGEHFWMFLKPVYISAQGETCICLDISDHV